jgi:hypothetical protein
MNVELRWRSSAAAASPGYLTSSSLAVGDEALVSSMISSILALNSAGWPSASTLTSSLTSRSSRSGGRQRSVAVRPLIGFGEPGVE